MPSYLEELDAVTAAATDAAEAAIAARQSPKAAEDIGSQPVAAPVAAEPLGEVELVRRLAAALDLSDSDWATARAAAQQLYGRTGRVRPEMAERLPLAFVLIWGDLLPCRSDWLWVQMHADAQRPRMTFRRMTAAPPLRTECRARESATGHPLRLHGLVALLEPA